MVSEHTTMISLDLLMSLLMPKQMEHSKQKTMMLMDMLLNLAISLKGSLSSRLLYLGRFMLVETLTLRTTQYKHLEHPLVEQMALYMVVWTS